MFDPTGGIYIETGLPIGWVLSLSSIIILVYVVRSIKLKHKPKKYLIILTLSVVYFSCFLVFAIDERSYKHPFQFGLLLYTPYFFVIWALLSSICGLFKIWRKNG